MRVSGKVRAWVVFATLTAMFLLLCRLANSELLIPRAAYIKWDNATDSSTTWEYRLYENTCHYQGNGVTKGITKRPEIKLGDICSMKWVYAQVRSLRNGLNSEWVNHELKMP